MKLRIKGNSLRLRLSQTEVSHFKDQGKCADQINLGGRTLFYSLEKSESAQLKVEFIGDHISVLVPIETGQQWTKDETQVGFDHSWKDESGNELLILVEKDFACLAERPHEDESDNFPNPMAGQANC